MNEQRDPHGENPTEAFLKTLGDAPQSDGGAPELPRIDPSAFATLPATDTDTTGEPEKPALEGSDAEAYEALKRRRAERRKKKLIRRGIVAGVVLAVAAVGVGIWWFTSRQTPEQNQMAPVTEMATRGTFTDAVDAKGTLEPNALTVVSAQIDGTIASVDVAEGQHVDAGTQLLTIKNDQLDAEVNEAARNVEAAKGTLNAAVIRRDEAKKAANTPSPTVADPETGQTVSAGGMMGSKADVADAQAAVNQAQGQLDSANAALAAAQAKAAQRTVTAPAAGSIVNLNAKVGASLSDIAAGAATSGSASGAGLMQIADLSKMKVTVQVGEKDIAKVSVGQQANVTFPAFADITLTGTITGIASIASTDSSGMSYGFDGASPTFAVDVLIDAPDGRLKPGMTAEVQLVTKQLDDVVMVPTMALLTDDGTNYYVNVLKDPETGETKRCDVTVVAQNDDFAVIGKPKDSAADSNPDLATAPVEDGDTLVVSGNMNAGDMGGASGDSGAVSGGMAVM